MNSLAEEIIAGRRLGSREEALPLVEAELEALCRGADRIRSALCGSRADLCTIVNGRSGQCGEDCKFCAQSCHYGTQVEEYPFLPLEKIVAECRRNEAGGVHRFSIVTAGRSLKGMELEQALEAYARLHRESGLKLCASHGLQTQEEFERMKAAGVDRIMTMDLHADQIQGFFDVPVDALYASGIFVPYIKSLNIEDLSIAAPDMGGAKRANTYSKLLGTPIIISHKERAKANVVGKMTAIGDVEGRNVLIVDDMIDTAGTICMAADMLMSRGAKSVRAAITHPVLSGPAYERINESALEEVIVTDTIPLNPDKDLHKFTVLSVADLFADVIERVHNYKEISSIFSK